MGFLAKLFNATPREKLKGASLGKDACWEVSPVRDFPSLLGELHKILPQGSILYLEGGTPPAEIGEFLNSHCVPEETHVAMGTIWPKPQAFHLPATAETCRGSRSSQGIARPCRLPCICTFTIRAKFFSNGMMPFGKTRSTCLRPLSKND